jgi:hypothetical protein
MENHPGISGFHAYILYALKLLLQGIRYLLAVNR